MSGAEKLSTDSAEWKPWLYSAEQVAERLAVNWQEGLSSAEVLRRQADCGLNSLAAGEAQPAWKRFLNQFKSPVVIILLVATFVSSLLGEYADAVAIVAIVVLNACIGYFQEARAEAAVEALKKLAAPRTRVLRDGRVMEVPSDQAVPGDILVFEAGDYVAADARLFLASQLTVDEAVLTGESLPVSKSLSVVSQDTAIGDRTNMIFAGTAISLGAGKAIVTATGMNTEIGRIAGLLEGQEKSETPLQERLEQVSAKLLVLCLVVVAIVGVFGLVHNEPWLAVLMAAISLSVAAIPEGLPAVVTLALALAIRRMAKRNVIIRHLPAVETLGSTDVICTDKTGTLTTGKMRVREIILANGQSVDAGSRDPLFGQLLKSAVLCSNASLSGAEEAFGDPTEAALLFLAREAGYLKEIQASSLRSLEWSFDSVRKRMSVAASNNGRTEIHVKGAPESILPLCELSELQSRKLDQWMNERSAQGRRLLAIATSVSTLKPEELAKLPMEQIERNLTLLGVVAIADPPRKESMAAIENCKRAGIRVVMITGDHPNTARAIAKELGILVPGSFEGVITGTELAAIDQKELEKRVKNTAVYARVSPEDKLRIVNAWKSHGSVVAMTGDGVNDAPALKAASIGVSMGRGGTEVARQASSMILADDNFSTIVSAVEEGRAIFGNVRRTIQYLLSGNLSEILVMLGAAIAGWPAPLMPLHLLWINLVTDGLPSLALAAEPVPDDVLKSKSRPSPKNFLNREFYGEMIFVGVVTAALALAIYGYSLRAEDELTARTHVFSFLVFSELFRSFACRHEDKTYFQVGPRSNLYHLFVGIIPVGFQLFLHHHPFFQSLFDVKSLDWRECGALLLLTLMPVTAVEVKKLFKGRQKLIRELEVRL